MFGNVNVDYKSCKSSVQLQRAAHYILGKLPEQISEGVVKTAPNLYWGINCDRDNFTRDVLMTRELFGKRNSKNANLSFKMSISFSPDDNDKLTYDEVFRIAKEFAEKYFQGYEVLFAVHTDKPHKHVHFLIGNCHTETGRAYRRNQKDLYDMCEFFGKQCMKRGLFHSVREDFYNHDSDYDKETFAERQMKAKGKETFKDELREVIQIELADLNNHTLEDVVNALMKHYNVECRVKGNTISYRHPNFTDKSGNLASVRGSKLGEKYTVKGIEHELREKQRGRETDRAEERPESILLTGEAETRCTADSQSVESRIYIKATGSGGTSGNTAARIGSDQSDDTGSGTAIGRSIGGSQEGRESTLARSSDTSNVPTLEELFSSYQRRNGEDSRKRTPEPEHTETVRRKRKGIDR
ncbi:MAG: relaxase/mobilization nuclease domain-containing protein [Alistipes sp.]|nr:relaxase/mobilization nuclease domain-containing protein [Alistipes sp.]